MKYMLTVSGLIWLMMSSIAQQSTIPASESDSIMLTVILKHQQDKNLDSIQGISFRNRMYDLFPPKAVKIVSWTVAMGLGQIVTLQFPAKYLRSVNLAIEKGVWGAFNTEIYVTYDFLPVLPLLKVKQEEVNEK